MVDTVQSVIGELPKLCMKIRLDRTNFHA